MVRGFALVGFVIDKDFQANTQWITEMLGINVGEKRMHQQVHYLPNIAMLVLSQSNFYRKLYASCTQGEKPV